MVLPRIRPANAAFGDKAGDQAGRRDIEGRVPHRHPIGGDLHAEGLRDFLGAPLLESRGHEAQHPARAQQVGREDHDGLAGQVPEARDEGRPLGSRVLEDDEEPVGGTAQADQVGLRHLLRQDPDIMMVGEVRDVETARIAIQAALTGHLVFSTVHTNDAPSTVNRMIDTRMRGIEFLAANTDLQALRKCRAGVKQQLGVVPPLG